MTNQLIHLLMSEDSIMVVVLTVGDTVTPSTWAKFSASALFHDSLEFWSTHPPLV